MPILCLVMWVVPFATGLNRIRLYRAVGHRQYAEKLFKRLSKILGFTVYAAMALQVYLVYKMGGDLIKMALPLHICGMTGFVTLPMLLGKSQTLRAFYVFIGMPCALMALLFPAVVASPDQALMDLAFFTSHSLIIAAGWLSFAKAEPLRPKEGIYAYGVGIVFMLLVYAVNQLLETNYMFLSFPPAGTPLTWLFQFGQAAYMVLLALIAGMVIALEALVLHGCRRMQIQNG